MQFSSSILACGTDMRHIVNEALQPRMFVQNFVVISPNKPLGKKLAPGGFKSHRLVSSSECQRGQVSLVTGMTLMLMNLAPAAPR